MKTALVLGGTQFFGKRLVNLLINNGVQVTIATRGNSQDSFGHHVKRLKIDRADKDSIVKAIGNQTWDVIYDQICFSSAEAQDAIEIFNGRCQKYIVTSTMAVYGFGENWKEEAFDPNQYKIEIKTRDKYQGFLGYQEAKRQSEAVLFQQANFDVVSVRPALVVGKDDYTERLKFHVDHVKGGMPISINNPQAKFGFVSSEDTAKLLYHTGLSNFTGTINAASSGGLSLEKLLYMIEMKLDKKAVLTDEGDASPYSFPQSLYMNNEKALAIGFRFTSLIPMLETLIDYYQ